MTTNIPQHIDQIEHPRAGFIRLGVYDQVLVEFWENIK
jgi:hypothetical protein